MARIAKNPKGGVWVKEKSKTNFFRFPKFQIFKRVLTLTCIPSQMSPGRRSWATDAYGGLKDAYGHNKKLLCVTPPSSGTLKHQKIEYHELTLPKGKFHHKIAAITWFWLYWGRFRPKYQIWSTSEPGNGSAWCQLVLEKYDGGLNWPKHNFLAPFSMCTCFP